MYTAPSIAIREIKKIRKGVRKIRCVPNIQHDNEIPTNIDQNHIGTTSIRNTSARQLLDMLKLVLYIHYEKGCIHT